MLKEITNCPLCNDKVPMHFGDTCCNTCLLETLLDHTTDKIEKMMNQEHGSTIATIATLQYTSDVVFEVLQRTQGKRFVDNGQIGDKNVLNKLKKDFNKNKKNWR